MKREWSFLHSSFVSTLLLFAAVGAMLLTHGVQSGALTIPLTKDQTTWLMFLFPWIDALLSWLVHGFVTGAWSSPNLSNLTNNMEPAAAPTFTWPESHTTAGMGYGVNRPSPLLPVRPAPSTPPEPQ